ncbi:UDP-2,3-diacylglucosamine diphosphatase LpxI [Paralimibaculum aggregatum]|uniref:UDP-2,3-diacylglucosamine diphosphatase LpxI n=1 Tax=Paralimibaculum aggregatum TaxID=3036245 RepID=A0ABQ6LQW8_9RHOB|nr:UDP-2,3-diacylglucosamine diphosphatase LpxI [Limibaculum sp. NKW23]GMG83663.1 UDP-2,3-diacylglucosamine diphosphatase LpxI [Limibaculum sp. NKW23]
MPSEAAAGNRGALAIIAGRGDLPRLIAEATRDAGRPYLVISFAEAPLDWVDDHPHEAHRFEKIGRMFRALKRAGCREVVFAGAMDRPRLRPWAFDAMALRVGSRVLRLLRQGDDAMLRGFGAIFEEEGIRLVAPADCIDGPALTAEPGVLGRLRPEARARGDVARAAEILRALGPVDVGQAAVVAGGVCLGVEAVEGTDALLARIAALPAAKRAHAPPPAGVLLKMPKPGQDRRLDLPAIGPRTVRGAAAAGLAGVAIEAGGVQILDRAATVAAADRAGIFLWSVAPEAL